MTESWNGQSAERRFLLSAEDFESRRVMFVKDPVSVLKKVREHFVDILDEDEDFDMAGETHIIVEDFADFMRENEIDTENKYLADYINHGSYTPEGDRGLFTLLKEAGYTKEEIRAWLKRGESHMPTEDRFMTKQSMTILERVYEN